MAIATSTMLAAGAIASVGTMGFGLYQQQQGREEAQRGYSLQQQGYAIQAQAAQLQAQISREQASTSVQFAERERALNIQSAQESLDAANASRAINQQIVGYEREVEAQRKQAMELDARRRQLEVIRNQQRARSIAITNATAQNAGRGTGLQGGYGQISGQSGVNLLGIQQNLQIGQNIFGLQSQITDQRLAYSDLENLYASQRAAAQTTRSNMVYDYSVANAAFQTRQADAGSLLSFGQGFVNQGSGSISQGQSQQQLGSTLFQAGPSIFNMSLGLTSVGPSLWGSTSTYTPGPVAAAHSMFGGGGRY